MTKKCRGGYGLRFVSHSNGLWEHLRQYQGQSNKDKPGYVPEEILLDRANGVDRSHVWLNTQDLEAQAGALLDHLVCMIRVLLRYCIRLPLDIRGDVLVAWLAGARKC